MDLDSPQAFKCVFLISQLGFVFLDEVVGNFFFFSVKGQVVNISGFEGLIVSAVLLIRAGVVWKQPQKMGTHVHMAGFRYNLHHENNGLDEACGL